MGMNKEIYKGWRLVSQRQNHPQFPEYCVIATKEIRNKINMFNVEAHDKKAAFTKARKIIDGK